MLQSGRTCEVLQTNCIVEVCFDHKLDHTPSYHLLSSQLQMFLAVDQQSPGLLEQLGISSDYIQQEMKKFEEVQKLKVQFHNGVQYLAVED